MFTRRAVRLARANAELEQIRTLRAENQRWLNDLEARLTAPCPRCKSAAKVSLAGEPRGGATVIDEPPRGTNPTGDGPGSGPPADILLAVRIPGGATSEFVNTLLADHPDMSRAEAWRRSVVHSLGAWPDVEIVGLVNRPAAKETGQVVHAYPVYPDNRTSCCGLRPSELPGPSTTDPYNVTCEGGR